ncbi:MAG: hypothetical protein E7070_12600 [Bacteroidales bacterium]|nr:hypothetical protein [Bacteroidales bacterium]
MLVADALADEPNFTYRRGSIYSLMIGHRDLPFAQEIEDAFNAMPVPDKYNDHGLGKKIFYTDEKKLKIKDEASHRGFRIDMASDKEKMTDFDLFLQKQGIASRLVAKWFGRKKTDGVCNMQLVQERGYNNASEVDKRVAELSVRKDALLMDAGEELIGSTFVLVNDIRYFDRSTISSAVGGALSTTINIYNASQGKNTFDQENLGTMLKTIKGFNVKIKTYLYQLVWDDEASGLFYKDIYTEQPDETKRSNFENNRGRFALIYLGMQESSGKDVSFMGINESEPQLMVRKACQRALDENVANLQRNFEVFKIKSPLLDVEPLRCEIGKKEGVTENSRFEVLEISENEQGHIEYKRKGVIRPVKGQIWDNRFMAAEENAEGANLGSTTFEIVSGKDFYPGMLVREIK